MKRTDLEEGTWYAWGTRGHCERVLLVSLQGWSGRGSARQRFEAFHLRSYHYSPPWVREQKRAELPPFLETPSGIYPNGWSKKVGIARYKKGKWVPHAAALANIRMPWEEYERRETAGDALDFNALAEQERQHRITYGDSTPIHPPCRVDRGYRYTGPPLPDTFWEVPDPLFDGALIEIFGGSPKRKRRK